MATQNVPAQAEGDRSNGWSVEQTTDILTALGAAVGFLYALGIIVLALQIWFAYRLDFSATWYAATLVPLKIVLGQGLRVFSTGWAAIPTFGLILFFDSTYRDSARIKPARNLADAERASEDAARLRSERKIAVRQLQIMVGVIVGTIVVLTVGIAIKRAVSGQWLAALQEIGRTVGTMLVAVLLGYVLHLITLTSIRRNRPVLIRRALLGAAFYVFLIIGALFDGNLNKPPLPAVSIALDGTAPARGHLLSHTDSHWHVITEAGDILAIPDSKSGIVTIPKRPGIPSAGTPTPRPSGTPATSP